MTPLEAAQANAARLEAAWRAATDPWARSTLRHLYHHARWVIQREERKDTTKDSP